MNCACGSLFTPRVTLEIQQQQEEQQEEKGYLKVMADPLDLGHGKKGRSEKYGAKREKLGGRREKREVRRKEQNLRGEEGNWGSKGGKRICRV